MKIRFLELFGGIGGFRYGFETSTAHRFECVGYYDIDKWATAVFNHKFGENNEPKDITLVSATSIPDHDLLCAGFPCQSFSLAGKRLGFQDKRYSLL